MNITNELGLSTDIASQVDPTLTPMNDTDLEAMMGQEITDAVSYIDSDLSPIRARGTEYYRGDPFGNEDDGRSQVVAMEVRLITWFRNVQDLGSIDTHSCSTSQF